MGHYKQTRNLQDFMETARWAWENVDPETRATLQYWSSNIRDRNIRNLGDEGILELISALAVWYGEKKDKLKWK